MRVLFVNPTELSVDRLTVQDIITCLDQETDAFVEPFAPDEGIERQLKEELNYFVESYPYDTVSHLYWAFSGKNCLEDWASRVFFRP